MEARQGIAPRRLRLERTSTLQAARRERFAALDKLWAKGVPLNVCSQVLDLGLPRVPGDETGYLPATVVPIPREEKPAE